MLFLSRSGSKLDGEEALGSLRNDVAPATRKHTKWSPSWPPNTSMSQKAGGGGGEHALGSIRLTSYLHLQL
ncbi:hypothetical protein PBY51_014238 [Eleginops maclovinus]|uniref:Uncharacterized protein n=1 Tax=Eleginops maclovinus TaxID=56733 RepID=A0AAN8ABJ7_ELEMC|nr:hypothetical protein PBY51_014238 [Eleginops maclovinus]